MKKSYKIGILTSDMFSTVPARMAPDDGPLADALRELGAEVVAVPWQGLGSAEGLAGLVVRSPWDYSVGTENLAAFRQAMQALPETLPVCNDWSVIAWNLDKAYLWQLDEAGVEVVPTLALDNHDWQQAGDPWPDQTWVVKPSISAGARLTLRLEPSRDRLEQFLAQRHELENHRDWIEDAQWLIQPFLPEVQTSGEWSMVYIDGEFSHAVRKQPAANHWYVQAEHGGQYEFSDPPAALREQADRELQTTIKVARQQAAAERILYARMDYIPHNNGYLLGEAELFEPELFLPQNPNAAARLAKAVWRECVGSAD